MPTWTTMTSQLALVLALTALALWLTRWGARRLMARLNALPASAHNTASRLRTLLSAGRSAAYVLLSVAGVLMSLSTLGIDVGPLVAGAGLAGLALTLGAQSLIRDYFAGLLILLENQFVVGDVIRINNEAQGEVERITLRTIALRDAEGRQHIIANGDIRLVSNMTAHWARALVTLDIPLTADVTLARTTLEQCAAALRTDPALQADVLTEPECIPWVGLTAWSVQMQLAARTRPGAQWRVMRLMRERALAALAAHGISLARPRGDEEMGR